MSSEDFKHAMESISVTLGAMESVIDNKDFAEDLEGKTVEMLKRINSELELQLEGIRRSGLKVVEPCDCDS